MVGGIVDVALLSDFPSIEEIMTLLWCGLYASEDIDQTSICCFAWGEKRLCSRTTDHFLLIFDSHCLVVIVSSKTRDFGGVSGVGGNSWEVKFF